MAKIFVPIGAMERETFGGCDFFVAKEHNIRDVGEVVIGMEGAGAATHFGVAEFTPNVKNAGWGSAPFAGGNEKGVEKVFTFVGVEGLVSEVDVDFFTNV